MYIKESLRIPKGHLKTVINRQHRGKQLKRPHQKQLIIACALEEIDFF